MWRWRPELSTIVSGGAALPITDCAFALMYSVAVLHHVPAPKAVRWSLIEMAWVTRYRGRVVSWNHNPRNPNWLLMRQMLQDACAEQLISDREIGDELTVSWVRPVLTEQRGLGPDPTPLPFLATVAAVARIPTVPRLRANNVFPVVKDCARQQVGGRVVMSGTHAYFPPSISSHPSARRG